MYPLFQKMPFFSKNQLIFCIIALRKKNFPLIRNGQKLNIANMVARIQQFIENAHRWTVTFGVVSFFYLLFLISGYYATFFEKWHLLFYISFIPLLYLFDYWVEKSLSKIIYKSSLVRKIILGKHFIEGHWIEILYEKGKMDSLAFLEIIYQSHNQYAIKGESYTLSGEYRGSFLTPNTTYSENEFALGYSYSGRLKEALIIGTGVLEFAAHNKKLAHAFSGHLIDNFHAQGAIFKGERIDDLEKIASLRAKKEFMREFVSEKILLQKEKTVYS